ncbi:Hypothetical predicted protein [Paramuricea clavata]|uniref:Uncharacterized protein n=1 Tax=Paramuricea clavata TaxID=317549 RepID=A0A6S7FJX1_PARCT|nr:Hypothetical predicted protein [Paramuricea clavata]
MEKQTKIRYGTEKAIQYILAPGSDSELSELEDDDDCVDEVAANECCEADNPESDDSDVDDSEETTPVFKWKKKEPEAIDVSFSGAEFTLPDNVHELSPFSYFKMFWDDTITQNIVEQTNLYSVQQTGSSISTTKDEIEKLIGLQMKMGIVKMPNYELYWEKELRYEPIASVMPSKRYKKLRQFLHVNDNSKKDDPDNKDNRLYKVLPVIEGVRQNCLKVEPEISHSIDEQIIPAKTKYSGIRQYNPKKPTKWGFKNFVRAGKSGMIYDFFIYAGAKSTGQEKCTSESVVLKLCESLAKNCNHLLFFDNWFATLPLMLKLKSLGYPTTATVRANRIAKCPLKSEKQLKKDGRGSFDYRTDDTSSKKVKRWDGKAKKHVDVKCPDVVCQYNESMGGVDLADMLIALYRTKIKTKRWYLKVLFHCVDIAKVNAWILYRRHCDMGKVPKKQQQPLLDFNIAIAESLIKCGKSGMARKRGRPSLEEAELRATAEKRGRKPDTPLPAKVIRLDSSHHWPEYKESKNRCRHCKLGFSRVYCDKCNVCLCLSNARNCFRDFHTL